MTVIMTLYRTIMTVTMKISRNLKEEDKIFPAGPLGNYSLAGFEMVT